MKNLFENEVSKEIFSRIDKVSSSSKPQWGKMNVEQALHHMTLGLKIPLQEIRVAQPKRKLPPWLMRFILLNMKAPKGKAETFWEINVIENNIKTSDLETERKLLKSYVSKFLTADSLLKENALAGKFSHKDWGRLMYSHCDHHLRQLGV